ncbi:MAG: alpha/beta hydrolase [Bacteroidia bacterium]
MEYLLLIIGSLVFFAASSIYAFYVFQERILFKPTQLSKTHEYKFPIGLTHEEWNLNTSDDGEINGIKFMVDNPKAQLFYFHGNSLDAQFWGEWVEILANRYQMEAIMMDYRGYGKSTGKRSMDTMLNDASEVYKKFNNGNLKSIIHGRSLGGAFASHVASAHEVEKLILESTFTKTTHIVLPHIIRLPDLPFFKYHFQSIDSIKKLNCELEIIHGEKDALIPAKHALLMFNAYKSKNKKMHIIAEGTHNDMYLMPEYHEILDQVFIID